MTYMSVVMFPDNYINSNEVRNVVISTYELSLSSFPSKKFVPELAVSYYKGNDAFILYNYELY